MTTAPTTTLAALAMIGSAAPAALMGAPVNPVTTPVQVTVPVPMAHGVGVRIVQVSDGRVVATLGPATGAAIPVVLPWTGGRGPGGSGPVVPDGTYRVEGLAPDGVTPLPADPPLIEVDTTPPAPVVRPPAPTIPASTRRSLPLRAGGAADVRAVVRRPGRDAVLAAGAWKTVEGRDAAGNTGTGAPVVWSVQPRGSGTRVVRRVRTGRPLVAITVDDGYGPREAARMIAAARDADVTITFCFNAINARMWNSSLRSAMRAAVRSGHLDTCSHGYAHRTGTGTSRAAGITDLSRNRTFDRVVGVATAPFYRPPYGAYGSGLLSAAAVTGYRYTVLWDVDTNDWRGPSASAITQRAVSGARKGSIILMHTKPNSAAAMPAIIRGLKAKGLRPVGLGELFSAGRPA